jgi:hypothetical protein
VTDKMRGQTSGGLLDHPPIKAALEDKAASYWLRDLLASAASRDPVDVLADLDSASALVRSWFDALTSGARLDIRPHQMPGGA